MKITNYPLKAHKFKVACIQDSPCFLDAAKTTQKIVKLIQEAASNDAKIIAFPEVFLPGYPYWSWLLNPVEGSSWFKKLVVNSVYLDGPEVQSIQKAAKENQVIVVIGINERDPNSLGALYNTVLTIDNYGELIGVHRKLVPTWAEKLTWTNGDGSSIKVHKTEYGPIGALACGENTNTLARFSLLAQGELIHIANYISLPVAPASYDMAEAIKIRAMAHSFEGKVYTLVSTSVVSDEIIDEMTKVYPKAESLMRRKNSSFSGVIGPDGRVVGEALIDKQGIVYAQIDLENCIEPKQMHDIIGHYNRFDIFNLSVDKRVKKPLTFIEDDNNIDLNENKDKKKDKEDE